MKGQLAARCPNIRTRIIGRLLSTDGHENDDFDTTTDSMLKLL